MTPFFAAADADFVVSLLLEHIDRVQAAGRTVDPIALRVLRRLVSLQQRAALIHSAAGADDRRREALALISEMLERLGVLADAAQREPINHAATAAATPTGGNEE